MPFNCVPFTFRETIGGMNHLRFRLQRVIARQPADYYLRLLANHPEVEAVPGADKSIEICWICGFAMARVKLPGGWTAETCSASGVKQVLSNKRLDEWSNSLPRSVSSVSSLPGTKV